MCFYCFFAILVCIPDFIIFWGSEHGVHNYIFFGFVFVFVETSLWVACGYLS